MPVTEADPVSPAPRDPDLPLLTGPTVADVLTAALEPAGGRLLDWSLRDVDHRPGDRTTASYTARVAWPDGERDETLAASVSTRRPGSGPGDGPDGGLVVTDGDRHIQIWRFPFDPELPGLAAACFPSSAADLLRGLGLPADDVQLRVLTYRPRKRAVVEVTSARHRLFLKVLRPSLAAGVHDRHRLLTAAGVAVPRSLGWSDDGIVALAPLDGTPLRNALEGGATTALADPGDLVTLLDRLPTAIADLPARQPWSAHASHYAAVVAAAVPSLDTHVRGLAHDITSGLTSSASGSDHGAEPTHGDLYDAQVFVADGAISGLLDIDTMGPGRRADDLACLLAHLSVLVAGDFPAASGARTALDTWTPVFDRRVDPVELRTRAAGVALSLATGPHRAQDPGWETATAQRVDLVERWLDAASRAGSGKSESPLIRLS